MADATQPLTQLDPRRTGRNNSGLRDTDVSDVLCILHPGSPAAFRIVEKTASANPQHVLQNWRSFDQDATGNTFILRSSPDNAQDLALRFSSKLKFQNLGFVFGRNPQSCDVVLVDELDNSRRVSNVHFRIYPKDNGVLMLEDQSTNGTLVDDHHIKGRDAMQKFPSTRVLENGSTIAIPSPVAHQRILFHVRIPSREGFEQEFRQNFIRYLSKLASLRNPGLDPAVPATADPTGRTLVINSNSFGMKWNGGVDYRVSGFLGKGAFAHVYRLTTRIDGTYLAVKELEKRRFVKDGVLDRRLSNEMAIMKSINHDRIVKYIDYHDINDHLYILMEYVPFGDLQQYLKTSLLTEPLAKTVARQTLDALAYLHSHNITHRDIKPDNILVASKDPMSIKLSDFGLSKVQTAETFLKTFCGTLLYCAPEVFPHFQSEKQGLKRRHSKKNYSYDHAVDIWSLGGVLWFAMTGHPPFEGVVDPTGRGMYDRITQTQPNMTHLDRHAVSKAVQALLKSMLTIQPDGRPSAVDCLNSSWLFDGTTGLTRAHDLNPIVEETEEATKLSQLSLYGAGTRTKDNAAQEDEFLSDWDLEDLEHLLQIDAERSARFKRAKKDPRPPRDQIRDCLHKQSSDDLDPSTPGQTTLAGKRRLFGEIRHSALQDSDVLGLQTEQTLTTKPCTNKEHYAMPATPLPRSSVLSHGLENLENPPPAVGDATTESPFSSDWLSSQESSSNSLFDGELPLRQMTSYCSGEISKHCNVEANDAIEDEAESTPTNQPVNLMPDTMHLPNPERVSYASESLEPHDLPSAIQQAFNQEPPRYGTLITTKDSEQELFYPINTQHVSWGRVPSNTLIYSNNLDTRIPKRAFALMFHDDQTEESVKRAMHWTAWPHLRVWIKACSNLGLWINGVRLEEFDPCGESLFGKLHSGDILTIVQPKDDLATGCLRFVCDFTVGHARFQRSSPFQVTEPSKPTRRLPIRPGQQLRLAESAQESIALRF